MRQQRKDSVPSMNRLVHGLHQRNFEIGNPMAGSLWSWSKQASGLLVQSYALSN